MDNNPFFKQVFRVGLLWGYSDLFEKLYGEVQPALVEEHEKKRESEKSNGGRLWTMAVMYLKS